MANKLDLVIFAATGFTGKKAVEIVARGGKQYEGLKWAIAGRSEKKLQNVLQDVMKKTGADLSNVKLIIADVHDDESLLAMCKQTLVLVNCCGPYRLYGEAVIKNVVKAETHYVDLCGEPEVLEGMQLKYNTVACQAAIYVVSACGFESVPTDMGILYLQQHFGGTVNSVESYMSCEIPFKYWFDVLKGGCINYGTWQSLVYSLSHANELYSIRRALFILRIGPFKPKVEKRSYVHKHGGGYCVPFIGADNSVVYRTQRNLHEVAQARPVQFRPFLKFPNLFFLVVYFIMGAIVYLMTRKYTTRNILLKFPRLFSCGLVSTKGPKQEVLDNMKFEVELVGRGWRTGSDVTRAPLNKTVVAKISGQDPGYGCSALCLMQCGMALVREQIRLPVPGVMTPGMAFSNTQVVNKLQENNVKFEIIQSE